MRSGLYLTVILCAIAALNSGCRSRRNPVAAAPDLFAALPTVPLQNITRPSHHRVWQADYAVLPFAEQQRDTVTVHNVRNFLYHSDEDFIVRYEDRTYSLRELETVDFLVVPFKDTPSLAHTMLSFGFQDGRHLGVSVEARLEADESYSPLKGSLRQFELMYIVADERDLISRRTLHRNVDVFLYRTVATPAQAQELFVDVMGRVNQLAEQPEFYDTLTNNCTTNIVRHINQLWPGRLQYNLQVLLPGYSDRLAYDLGLLRTEASFQQTRAQAKVNRVANRSLNRANFSQLIRRR